MTNKNRWKSIDEACEEHAGMAFLDIKPEYNICGVGEVAHCIWEEKVYNENYGCYEWKCKNPVYDNVRKEYLEGLKE